MAEYLKEGIATYTTAEDIAGGQICVLSSEKTLSVATADTATSGLALFIAETDADAGKLVAAKIVGASTGTARVIATAGDYAPGAAVYVGDAGKVAASGSRQVGVYVGATATVEDGKYIEIAPVFVA